MKLGIIALTNYECDASVFTMPLLEILIPAFKSYLSDINSQYIPILPTNIDPLQYTGSYYYEGVYIFSIAFKNINNNQWLIIKSENTGLYGYLKWLGNYTFMMYDLYDNIDTCWAKTLGGQDGALLSFKTDNNGNIISCTLTDNAPGDVFIKNATNIKPKKYSNKYESMFAKYKQKYILKSLFKSHKFSV